MNTRKLTLTLSLTLIGAAALIVGACGGQQVRQVEDPQLTSAAVGWPDLGRGNARFIRIDLGPDSFAECRRLSPKFPFDSAQTYAQDRAQLGALAGCLNAPGMRERTILLVGRADPRGTDTYNDKLGMKRADAIKQLLIENGISAERIEVVTEGEKDALGNTPDYSFGYDRRVDVIVKGGAHLP